MEISISKVDANSYSNTNHDNRNRSEKKHSADVNNYIDDLSNVNIDQDTLKNLLQGFLGELLEKLTKIKK